MGKNDRQDHTDHSNNKSPKSQDKLDSIFREEVVIIERLVMIGAFGWLVHVHFNNNEMKNINTILSSILSVFFGYYFGKQEASNNNKN